METFGLSFIGRRETNQDAYLILNLEWGIFLAVADGMGGVHGGKIASNLVLKRIKDYLQLISPGDKSESLKEILNDVFRIAQSAIQEAINEDPSLNGMGTTLTCVLISNDKFVVGNIGDSRTYFYSQGHLNLITRDHTVVNDYIEKNKGEIDSNIIEKYSHLLTRTIDGGGDSPDIFPVDSPYFTLNNGDGFLLCCDGLILEKQYKSPEYLQKYFEGSKNLQRVAENLIAHAFHNGSDDNITVVLAFKGKFKAKTIAEPQYAYPPKEENHVPKIDKSGSKWIKKIAVSLVLFILGIMFVWYKFYSEPWEHKENLSISDTINVKIVPKTKPKLIKPVRWAPEPPSTLPRLSQTLSWLPPEYENDHLKYYIVRWYDDGKNFIDSTIVERAQIDLSKLRGIEGKTIIFCQIVAVSQHGKLSKTELKKIPL